MNRHAYLIMAHNHFDFLKDLLLRLDDPRNDIYLHVDAAASDFHPGEFTNLLSSSRLFLTDRLRVHWGGYSQIAAELTLLRAASREHYLYYHLLSGSDLPLKSQEQIHTFFDTWSGKEFLAFDSLPVPVSVTERISLWHFFRESRFPLAEPLDHLLTLIQRLFHVNRLKKETFSVRKGPNWFSITDNFAQYVLQQEDWIQAHFRRSVCADELFTDPGCELPLPSPYLRRRGAHRLHGKSALCGLGGRQWQQSPDLSGNRPGHAAGPAPSVCTEV